MILFLLSFPLSVMSAEGPQPTPTVDRLAAPVVPENPSQVDIGRSLYYYNCMPCHGDYGQGLTDEFRGIWEEDHQNCWEPGCHSGRAGEEGFPIPRIVPAVNIAPRSEQLFPANGDLYEYLRTTHPPQNPGWLKDDEYHALTAYLFSLAGRQPPASEAKQMALSLPGLTVIGLAAVLVGVMLFIVIITRWYNQRR